ncbi:bifunctional diguanylate cyclase/phosphodiesterase [Bradyrhizobium sp.]|uniref:bifunctional diguanylate cyclase/phosphodiesterase n=1 Tax=Bradyrhizobium sp. TaxID=376 RepID=UPI002D67EA78|nr:EAL domain-containing protein [Bradyrhizobium sp.]HZR75202.1 EAL domain-containing protein [Bradyrhizobium sp.]
MFGVKAWIRARRSGIGTAHVLAPRGIACFVALACTVLVGLEISHVIAQRSQVVSDARQDTANLAGSLIQHAELTFRTADAILLGVVERVERKPLDAGLRERLKAWFAKEIKNSNQFVAFGVLDEHGTMVVNMLGAEKPGQFADRDYFIYHRSHDDEELRIGRPVHGRTTGQWHIPVTRRINKADGTFGGVAIAAVNPQYFQDIYDRLELGDNSAVMLATTDGTLLVRRPFVDANVGRDITTTHIFPQVQTARTGSVEIKASIDGVTRYNSFEKGNTYPVFVVVAQNMEALLAPWRESAIRRLIETAVMAGLILLMGAFVWRATRNLAKSSLELSRTNARFDAALANMPAGLSMFDADGKLMVWNQRYLDLYGMSSEVVGPGTDVYDIASHRKQTGGLDGDARTFVNNFWQGLRDVGRSENTTRLNNGHTISVVNTAMPGGGWVAIHEDITERVSDEEALFNQAAELARINMRFGTALSNMAQGLCMFDERKRLVVWNRRYAELHDVPEALLKVGTPFETLVADQLSRGVIKGYASADAVKARVAEVSELPPDSQRIEELADGRFVLLTRQPMRGGGWLTILEDITDRRRAEAEIVHLARHDVLTSLPNRAQFNEKLAEAGKRLKRGGAPVTVMMVDLDRFKNINDTLGHPAGDALLIEAGRRLKTTIRETDLLARLGGDEFAIIQEGGEAQHEGAISLALRILGAIGEPFDLNGFEVNIGASIGIAMAPEHGSEGEGLLKSADLALYTAKAEGRNDYRIYHPHMLETATSQQLAESELRDAIALSQFEVHYQPVVDVKTRKICGVEALVRWRHPVKGLVGPDKFIPLAEQTGLIAPIGEWILHRACSDAAKWPADINIAINISAVQFKKGNLFDVILCALVESGLEPTRLELEITETSMLENQEAHLATIRQLKNLGISLALDDFCTGYSSVTYLTNFPFDKIKIDKSFTQGVLERRDYAAVVSSVLALAQGLGKVTTVEGIETEAQFEYMRQAGVELAQGYLFSRPVPASELDFTIRYPSVKQNMVA